MSEEIQSPRAFAARITWRWFRSLWAAYPEDCEQELWLAVHGYGPAPTTGPELRRQVVRHFRRVARCYGFKRTWRPLEHEPVRSVAPQPYHHASRMRVPVPPPATREQLAIRGARGGEGMRRRARYVYGERNRQAAEMRRQGHTLAQIARAFGFRYLSTAYYAVRKGMIEDA